MSAYNQEVRFPIKLPLKFMNHDLPVGESRSAHKDLLLNRSFGSKDRLGQQMGTTYTKLLSLSQFLIYFAKSFYGF